MQLIQILYFFKRKEINFLLDRDFKNNLKVSFFFIFLCSHTLLQSHISKVTSRNKNDCKIDNNNFVICCAAQILNILKWSYANIKSTIV